MTASSGSGAADQGRDDQDHGIREEASSMASDAAQGAQNIAEEVREQVREGVAYAREEAERQAREGVHYGADQVQRTATALRSAAQDLDGTFQGEIFRHAADGLQSLSDDMRDKSIGEIIGDVAVYARRHPVTYLGGALLAGFALTRFVRASADHGRHHHHHGAGGHRNGKDAYGRERFHSGAMPTRSAQPDNAGTPSVVHGGEEIPGQQESLPENGDEQDGAGRQIF